MPEPTWTFLSLTLPITSWVNMIIAVGTLVAGVAAAVAAIFTWRGYKSQIEAQRPFIGRVEPQENIKGDGFLKLINVGGRAAINITGEATIIWVDDSGVRSCGCIWSWSRISPLAPKSEAIVIPIRAIFTELQPKLSSEFSLDKQRLLFLAFQIEYYDIRKKTGSFRQRFFTQVGKSAIITHFYLDQEKQIEIDKFINKNNIFKQID